MAQTDTRPDRDSNYRTPRWVKLLSIVTLVLVLLMGAVMLATGGEHGPGRHMPPASITETRVVEDQMQPGQQGG